jgi:hypothetical protein
MNIVFQFLGESILISLIAFLCALAMTELSLPLYNSLIDTTLSIDYGSVFFWMMAIGIVLITGVLAGSYPAFYLSSFSFRPAEVAPHQGKSSSFFNLCWPSHSL